MMAGRSACLVLALGLGLAAVGVRAVDERPVTKVITLLKDMVTQLEKESEEDEETYEAMMCWCETNDKDKTKAIADAEGRIEELNANIEGFTATGSQLSFELSGLNKELGKNQEALATATALRQKQLAEFNQEEKDALVAINSLKSAIQTLSKQNAASFLQVSDDTSVDLLVNMRRQVRRHFDFIKGVTSRHQRRVIASFLQDPSIFHEEHMAFLQQEPGFDGSVATAKESYEPQSGEIFGVLTGMKESFETNLAASGKEEDENVRSYEGVKASKEQEIGAGETTIETKTELLATADEKNAQSKQDLEDTENSLAADKDFLANLKVKCAEADAEYQERTKTRQLEIQAVSKALEFLSGDEAHDLFARSLGGASLLQMRAKATKRTQVATLFQKAALKIQDPRLSNLAVRVRLDKFTKVKASIQEMVDKLTEEKEDDIAHKDFCVEELNKNQMAVDAKDKVKADLIAKIEDLTMTMDELSKSIETLKAEVAEAQVQLKKSGEEREKANKEFQVTVADQRATQKLLMAALNVLKGFYEKSALVQSRVSAKAGAQGKQGPPPPPGFKSYENNAASGGVMGMMQGIIDDAKKLEMEAVQAEADSQKAYESFVKETTKAIEEKQKDITNKSVQKGKAEQDKVEATVNRDEALMNLEQLFQEAGDLHRSCDFLLKNFGTRAAARDEEIEALKQGIAMFSGASFSALIQQWDLRRR